jgi:metallo-beta-lactamase family protein
MMGEAATDYKRVAELDTRKNEIEERLLQIYEELGYFTSAPYSGDIYDLDTGECVEKAPVVRIPPKVSAARKRANAVFERLMLAGRRLISVIEQNRGGANKDLAKFTSQIDALCDKWERK